MWPRTSPRALGIERANNASPHQPASACSQGESVSPGNRASEQLRPAPAGGREKGRRIREAENFNSVETRFRHAFARWRGLALFGRAKTQGSRTCRLQASARWRGLRLGKIFEGD